MINATNLFASFCMALALAYMGNGVVGLFMPGPRIHKWLVLLGISVPTASGLIGLALNILRGGASGILGPLGLDLVTWFFIYIVAQLGGMWVLVTYRAVWVARHWYDDGRNAGDDPDG
jgi:hypothetical protein